MHPAKWMSKLATNLVLFRQLRKAVRSTCRRTPEFDCSNN